MAHNPHTGFKKNAFTHYTFSVMIEQLPYPCQVNILLRLDFEDFKNVQKLNIWQASCKSVTVWRHLLNQSTQNCVILDSYVAKAIQTSGKSDSEIFTDNSLRNFAKTGSNANSRTSLVVRLLEQHIQKHEIGILEFKNSSEAAEKTPSFYEILRNHFFKYLGSNLNRANQYRQDQPEIDENKIPRVLLFGPDLSQTWIGIGNRERADTVKNLGPTITGGFKIKYLRGPNQNPFILNMNFRNSTQVGSYDETSGEYFLDHRVSAKCASSDRILLCIRNTLPYSKTQDFAELRAQLKKMILVMSENGAGDSPLVKCGILLTNYSERYDLLKPWDVLEKMKLIELCDEIREINGKLVFWKMLQIDVFDSRQDSHDAVDVFYQWLVQ